MDLNIAKFDLFFTLLPNWSLFVNEILNTLHSKVFKLFTLQALKAADIKSNTKTTTINGF
jgi:hypothetical protein